MIFGKEICGEKDHEKENKQYAGVTGDMVPSADPVLGTEPAGGSRSHWRLWF